MKSVLLVDGLKMASPLGLSSRYCTASTMLMFLKFGWSIVRFVSTLFLQSRIILFLQSRIILMKLMKPAVER
jgi:hypothetical protein